MGSFYFNRWTDEARDKLEELGVTWRRSTSGSGGVEIFTEDFDLEEQLEGEGEVSFAFDLVHYDRPKMRTAQGLRIWKHPEKPRYYYLIRETVFTMEARRFTDHSTSPATITEITVFDLVEEQEQDYWRAVLMKKPPIYSGPIPRLI